MLLQNPQNKTSLALAIMSQVATDIDSFLKGTKDSQRGLQLLARKSGLHEKTLKRLIQQEHRPGYITVYKLYRCLLGTDSDAEVADKAPPIITEFLKSANPKTNTASAANAEFSASLAEELKKDAVMLDLYFLAGCAPLTYDDVLFQMGLMGLKTVEKMKTYGLLDEITPRLWKLGSVQVNLDASLLKQAALRLTETYFNLEASELKGENYLGVYAEGLNEAGLSEWLKIDEQAYKNKVLIAQNPQFQGSIRSFTIQVTEQMSLKRNLK